MTVTTSNSNRSASPLSTRPAANPNFRSSELNNPIRKSFSGNPFSKSSTLPNPRSLNGCSTIPPAISPSDVGRRNSMDNIGGSIYDTNEKENEKEQTLKTMKMRSPSVPKTSKHFMAPTISTASKIAAPSPRKKVLTDKQEPTRTSINGMENSDSKSHIDPSVDVTVPPSNPNVSGSDVVTDIESNLVDGDLRSRFKISPSPTLYSPCPIIAPLDADPLVAPPYDPKTNFLSPRPQFLRYRPNPQISSYVHDDILTFESLSDTETTEESGSASEELDVETEDGSSGFNEKVAYFESLLDTESAGETEKASEMLVTETEDDSSGLSEKTASFESLLDTETIGETENASVRLVTETEGDSLGEMKVNDSDPISVQSDVKSGESKSVLQKPFFTKVKSISLILILVVAACLSISLIDNHQIINTPLFKDQDFLKFFDDPNEITKYVKESYDRVAEKISSWSSNCCGFFTKPIQVATNEQLSGVWFYNNLTALQDGKLFPVSVGSKMGDEIVSVDEKGSAEIEGYENEDVLVSRYVLEVEDHGKVTEEMDADSDVEDLDNEPEMMDSEVQILSTSQHEVRCEEMGADSEVKALVAPENTESEVEDLDDEPEMMDQAKDFDELENVGSEVPILSTSQHAVRYEEMDADGEVEALAAPENAESGVEEPDEPENVDSQVPIMSATQQEVLDEPETPLMAKEILDSTESTLEEIPITFETWDSTTDNNNNNPEAKRSTLTNIFGLCLLATSLIVGTAFLVVKQIKSSTKPKETVTKKAFLTHSPSLKEDNPTEVIMESEPCQSEMSSFEAQSCENRNMLKKKSAAKRESLASSSNISMGSTSYGSFTTYGIIQKKHGDEEERMVTPVRRSSRIRSHVTSP